MYVHYSNSSGHLQTNETRITFAGSVKTIHVEAFWTYKFAAKQFMVICHGNHAVFNNF